MIGFYGLHIHFHILFCSGNFLCFWKTQNNRNLKYICRSFYVPLYKFTPLRWFLLLKAHCDKFKCLYRSTVFGYLNYCWLKAFHTKEFLFAYAYLFSFFSWQVSNHLLPSKGSCTISHLLYIIMYIYALFSTSGLCNYRHMGKCLPRSHN